MQHVKLHQITSGFLLSVQVTGAADESADKEAFAVDQHLPVAVKSYDIAFSTGNNIENRIQFTTGVTGVVKRALHTVSSGLPSGGIERHLFHSLRSIKNLFSNRFALFSDCNSKNCPLHICGGSKVADIHFQYWIGQCQIYIVAITGLYHIQSQSCSTEHRRFFIEENDLAAVISYYALQCIFAGFIEHQWNFNASFTGFRQNFFHRIKSSDLFIFVQNSHLN